MCIVTGNDISVQPVMNIDFSGEFRFPHQYHHHALIPTFCGIFPTTDKLTHFGEIRY